MSTTNGTSRDELTINDLNRELRDDELDGVSGGLVVIAICPSSEILRQEAS
jgi:hypothetical protein